MELQLSFGKILMKRFTLGYLMKHGDFALQDAYDYVKSLRSIVKPNDSFMFQLRKYEATLKAKKTSLSINDFYKPKELKETNLLKMFPKSNIASQVIKTDRNLKHWFSSKSNRDDNQNIVESLNDNSDDSSRLENPMLPPTKKRTLMEYLKDTPDANGYSSVASDHTIASVVKGEEMGVENETWVCRMCTFENNCLLFTCEMCDTARDRLEKVEVGNPAQYVRK